jgi:pyridoxamine 5'-phosphate oxidase family protein
VADYAERRADLGRAAGVSFVPRRSFVRDAKHCRERGSREMFTEKEIEYLTGQRLGRLATVTRGGRAHVVPTGFRLSEDRTAIEIGGHNLADRRPLYLRNIEANAWVAFVVDDLAAVNPWTPRGVTVRGRAEILATGGERLGPGFDAMLIRIAPSRITSWGIDSHAFGRPNSRTVDPSR